MARKKLQTITPFRLNFFLLLSFACFLLFSFFVFERYSPRRLAFSVDTYPNTTSDISQSYPVSIYVERVNIELPVIKSEVKDGVWQTTTKGVSYLAGSGVPGTKGNVIMYGHNWPNMLAKLTQVIPGDVILVTMNNGSKLKYTVELTQTVTPDQVHILNQTEDTRITLYTCSGFFDSKRFVVTGIMEDSTLLRV